MLWEVWGVCSDQVLDQRSVKGLAPLGREGIPLGVRTDWQIEEGRFANEITLVPEGYLNACLLFASWRSGQGIVCSMSDKPCWQQLESERCDSEVFVGHKADIGSGFHPPGSGPTACRRGGKASLRLLHRAQVGCNSRRDVLGRSGLTRQGHGA